MIPRHCGGLCIVAEEVVDKDSIVDVMFLTEEVVVLRVVVKSLVECRVVSRVISFSDVFGVDIVFDEVCVRGKAVARLTSVAANKTAGIIEWFQ